MGFYQGSRRKPSQRQDEVRQFGKVLWVGGHESALADLKVGGKQAAKPSSRPNALGVGCVLPPSD